LVSIGMVTARIRQQIWDPLYRNSFFLMADTVVASGLGFFFWMVVARFYSEAEVGLAVALLSSVLLIGLFSRLGLDYALIRFLPKAERPADLMNSSFTVSGLAVIILSAIFLAGLDLWAPTLRLLRENAFFAIVFAITALLFSTSCLLNCVFIGKRRAEFVMSNDVILSLLKIPIPILLAASLHAFGIVASWGIAAAVALTVSLLLFIPRAQDRYQPAVRLDVAGLKGIWSFSAAYYLFSLFSMSPNFILPIMIVNLVSAEQNAYFYVAWAIASLLYAIPGAVSGSLLAEGSHFEDELAPKASSALRLSFIILVPALIILFLAGRWLLMLFGASYATNGLDLLWWLALSSLPLAANRVYLSILGVRYRVKELAVISGITALVLLWGSYLLLPAFGIVSIGYLLVGTEAAKGIYTVYRYKRAVAPATSPTSGPPLV